MTPSLILAQLYKEDRGRFRFVQETSRHGTASMENTGSLKLRSGINLGRSFAVITARIMDS